MSKNSLVSLSGFSTLCICSIVFSCTKHLTIPILVSSFSCLFTRQKISLSCFLLVITCVSLESLVHARLIDRSSIFSSYSHSTCMKPNVLDFLPLLHCKVCKKDFCKDLVFIVLEVLTIAIYY